MRLVYDIECNGLDPDTIWCIVAIDLNTGTEYAFSDHDNLHGSISDGVAFLGRADLLIGHNILGFDSRILDRLFGSELLDKHSHDTFVMSQVLSFKRPHKHGLAGWGDHLGNAKIDFHDWDNYSREMLRYCKQDVKVNVAIYNKLLEEYAIIYKRNPLIKEGLRIEHDTAVFNAKVREKGWKFETDKAWKTHAAMTRSYAGNRRCNPPKARYENRIYR